MTSQLNNLAFILKSFCQNHGLSKFEIQGESTKYSF